MDAEESQNRGLLEIIKHGKVEDLRQFLEKQGPAIDINKEDKARQYPLKLAVQLKKVDMVAEILKQEKVEMKDSFLHAINAKDISIIKMIHSKMKLKQKKPENDQKKDEFKDEHFPQYIVDQPLILACHNNDYNTIEFLMSEEYLSKEGKFEDGSNKIKIPDEFHKIAGAWYADWWREALFRKQHRKSEEHDNLQIEEKRKLLDILRAAASPVYICLCCLEEKKGDKLEEKDKKEDDKLLVKGKKKNNNEEDLFLKIFTLCNLADIYTNEYPLYEAEYKKIREKLDAFAVKLLDQCQHQKDVECILKKAGKDDKESDDERLQRGRYQRLKLAMEYDLKEVIAHRNCQQVLEDMWTGGNHKLMQVNRWTLLYFYLPRLFLLPFIYLVLFIYPEAFTPNKPTNKRKGAYELSPSTEERKEPELYWKTPMAKFSSDMISYCIFLILLAVDVAITPRESLGQRVPGLNGGLDIAIFLYMISFIWEGIEAIKQHGEWIIFSLWWMLHLWVMNIFFLVYMSTRLVSYILTLKEEPSYANEERFLWKESDVMLWSEIAYSYSIVLAFIKILYIFHDSKSFGPLQLSLAKMILVISKTLLIYSVILVAFTFGMSRLYNYYGGMKEMDESGEELVQPIAFSSLYNSLLSLFWMLLGKGSKEDADIIVTNCQQNQTNQTNQTEACFYPPNEHQPIETAGYLLYVLYQLIGGIILMRMLTALMTSTLNLIMKEQDVEWKFSRAGLWLTYFDQRSIFPNPMNVIPSPWGLYQSVKWCFCCVKNRRKGHTDCCYPTVSVLTLDEMKANDEKYYELTKRLAMGYLSDVEEQKTSRFQLMKRVHGSTEKWFQNVAGRAVKQMSHEPVQEETISPTKAGLLGALDSLKKEGKK